MARLLRIENCEQCGWSSRYDDKCNYVIPHRYFNYEDGIPDWCPLPEASGWIPVGERLPEEGERVPGVAQCSRAPHYNEPFVAMVFLKDGVWRWDENDQPVPLPWAITYWQALSWLPSLPEAEEATDDDATE